MSHPDRDDHRRPPKPADLLEELDRLKRTVESSEEREQVRRTIRVARRLPQGGVFGQRIRGFGPPDVAEAFVGSVVIGLPLLVEDGVLEIGAFMAASPVFFVLNLAFALGLVVGLLYVARFQRVEIVNPYFGVLPRRLVGVLTVSFVTATLMMTLWGRVDWADPWLALCQVSVIFTGMAVGASLGDILPGERRHE